jgi:hypothetical protein
VPFPAYRFNTGTLWAEPAPRGGAKERSAPRREIGLDDVVEHFTLGDHERDLLRNKTGSTRLGFAAMLKFLGWKGRFPRGRFGP